MRAGEELRQARERAGLSAEQIAERTKIQLYKIEALENDNFEGLPHGIYLDGIVRAYAHEVALNPEPLIERVRNERPQVAQAWQVGPDDLNAFPIEQSLSRDAANQPIISSLDVSDAPSRPARAGRFVLPLLLLLAAAGWGAYFLKPARGIDRDVTTPDTSASSPEPVRQEAHAEGASTARERAIPDLPSAAKPAPTADSPQDLKDVSGAWTLATHVESSSYARFEGLHLGYEIQLAQDGERVTGAGRKVTQNGDGISSRAQTPISVDGTIAGDRLTLTFNERGTRRPTQGKFVLLVDDGGTLRGRFSSTAARSSGSVEAHRVSR
jgi:cytoskeletal protein RodZ